eukprot:scaffold27268_cov110-Isochrysis_galbana.AAC.2
MLPDLQAVRGLPPGEASPPPQPPYLPSHRRAVGPCRSRLLGIDSGHFGLERVDALPQPTDDGLTLPRDALPRHELGLCVSLGLDLGAARLAAMGQREKSTDGRGMGWASGPAGTSRED